MLTHAPIPLTNCRSRDPRPLSKSGHKKEDVAIPALRDPKWDAAPAWLIGIDDTDNLDSRGTGFRARHLASQLQGQALARLRSVTRHQLFVSPEIPYTSHNSAACLCMDFFAGDYPSVQRVCRDYLLRESAAGADAGLCIAGRDQVSGAVQAFGRAAKAVVLQQEESLELARREGIYLEGLTGTRQGVIGALAAVGLHSSRDDGRYLWLRGVRDLQPGAYSIAELRARTDIEAFCSVAGEVITEDSTRVTVTEWARPVMIGGRSVMLLEEDSHGYPENRWRVAAKEHVKRY